jgi:ribosomal protein S18 acetylase RimI-like enzyme
LPKLSVSQTGGWCYWALEPYPLVYNLWVVPECRGQGYGRKLLRMAVAEIRASVGNERKIKVQAIPFDKGIYKSRLKRFYRSEGLVVMEKEEQ